MTTPETAAEIREQLRGMALSLATGSGPIVEPAAFDAALDAYRDAVLAEQPAVSSAVAAPPTDQAETSHRAERREQIAAILRPHANLGGAPLEYALPFFDGATPSLPRISGWKPLDEVVGALAAVLPAPADRAADEVDADTVANRAAQVITAMGDEIRELEHSRDRYRTAWLSARQRADRAAVLRDAIDLAREEAHRLEEEVGIEAARGARCVAYLLRKRLAKEQPLRRLADECPQCGTTGACNGGPCPLLHQADQTAHPCNAATMHRLGDLLTAHGPHLWVVQPGMDPVRCPGTPEKSGARHVHITIRHPDPTTANTAALCIADLIHAEYGDNLHLAITTDAQDTGPAPHRPADETPDTTADTFAGGSYLTAEHDTLGMIAARHGGDRLAWEMANPWVTSSAMVLPAGLRVAIPAQAGPAAGARQDGAPDDVVTELTEAEFHDAAGKALARLGLTYAELEDQARRRDFSSAQARSLWVTIGGAAPAGARQDGEAQ